MFYWTVVTVLLFAIMDVQIEVKPSFYLLETERKNGRNYYGGNDYGYESPSSAPSSEYGYASDGCESNPSAPGCGSTLPDPGTGGSSPPAPAGCESDPSVPGCESTSPAPSGCKSDPSAPGCESTSPALRGGESDPSAPGYESTSPYPGTDGSTPSTPCSSESDPSASGCELMSPTPSVESSPSGCESNPSVLGCESTSLATDTDGCEDPGTGGCKSMPPAQSSESTPSICESNPSDPGCESTFSTPGTGGSTPPAPCGSESDPSSLGCESMPPAPSGESTPSGCESNPSTPGCESTHLAPSGESTPSGCESDPSALGCESTSPAPSTGGSTTPTQCGSESDPSASGCESMPPTPSGEPNPSGCESDPSSPGCKSTAPAPSSESTESGCESDTDASVYESTSPAPGTGESTPPTPCGNESDPSTSGCESMPPALSGESTPSGCESDTSAPGCEYTTPAPSGESTPSGCESDPSSPGCESTHSAFGNGGCEDPGTGGCESMPTAPSGESTPSSCESNPSAPGCESTSPAPGEGESTSPAQVTCPTGYGWSPLATGCYKFVNANGGFYQHAKDSCESLGGFLVEVNNQEEQDLLRQFYQDSGLPTTENQTTAVWLGATDRAKDGHWIWDHSGEEMTFKAWYSGEPNGKTSENCLQGMPKYGFKWNDRACSAEGQKGLCENDMTTNPIRVCFEENVFYHSKDSINKEKRNSAAECQAFCSITNGCKYFSWGPHNDCMLMSSISSKSRGNMPYLMISGPKSCKDPLPDVGFECNPPACAEAGRPFIVQGRFRTTSSQICSSGNLKHAESWKMGKAPSVLLSNPHNQEIGHYWLKLAEAEHASVASFARHTLQLMSIGAPSRLLVASQEASLDEIKHARMCYGFASAFIGSNLGPGSLDVHGSLESMGLNGIIRSLIIEGCIGETLSAIEGHLAAHNAQDSAVKDSVSQIASDETKHAQLAWDTFKWIIDKYPDSRTFAEEIFHVELEHMMPVRNDSSLLPVTLCEDAKDTTFRRYGLLASGDREKVREAGILHIIEPIYRAGFKGVNMISKQIKELRELTL